MESKKGKLVQMLVPMMIPLLLLIGLFWFFPNSIKAAPMYNIDTACSNPMEDFAGWEFRNFYSSEDAMRFDFLYTGSTGFAYNTLGINMITNVSGCASLGYGLDVSGLTYLESQSRVHFVLHKDTQYVNIYINDVAVNGYEDTTLFGYLNSAYSVAGYVTFGGSDYSFSNHYFPWEESRGDIRWQQPNFPTNKVIETKDFEVWAVCVDLPDLSIFNNDHYAVQIYYAEDVENLLSEYSEDTREPEHFGTFYPNTGGPATICHEITKTNDFIDGTTYYAQAFLMNGATDLIAHTEIIEFYIIPGDKIRIPYFGILDDNAKYGACSKFSQVWFTILSVEVPSPIHYGCIFLIWSFTPSRSPSQYLEITFNRLENIYFFEAFKTTIDIFKSWDFETPDSTEYFAMNLPVQTGTLNTTIPFQGFDTESETLQEIFGYSRPWISAFAWLTFAYYLYRRATKLFIFTS